MSLEPRPSSAELANVQRQVRALFNRLRPRPKLTVSQWADANRILAGKAASEPGQWRTSRTPYLREPMDCLSVDSGVDDVCLWFGTQLGKSETLNNWLGYTIDYHPGPVILVQPTLELAKRYSKQRIASLISHTPALQDKVLPARSRDSGNTLLEKEFPGGILVVAGANSASGLRSMPVRDLLLDEIDAYPFTVDDEGDPASIAEKRQDTFANRKRIKTSTCTVKGASRIEQAYERSDKRRYYVPCPHCGHYQVLRWGQLRMVDGDPETAHYICGDYDKAGALLAGCGAVIEEAAKPDMLERGEWRAEAPAARSRGYWLSSLYSPLGWLSWAQICREYLEAKVAEATGDSTLLQTWTNTRLAETWEMKGAGVADDVLQRLAEDYPLRTVPRGALVLTAAVDVQGDRLELMILGWGEGEECWVIDYQKLYGDPAVDPNAKGSVWQTLDELLRTPLTNAWGLKLRISACSVDHGGHHATQVETFTRARAGRNVLAVKGQSQAGKPVLGRPADRETSYKGKRIKGGARVWPVGSDTAKLLLYQRLALSDAGPGYVHTSKDLEDSFYKGLTAEQLVTRYVKGRPRSEWVLPSGRRNEPLDLWVYAYAAAVYLGITRYKENDWQRERAKIEPPLFDPQNLAPSPAAPAEDSEAPPAPPARKPAPPAPRAPRVPGFAGRWRHRG